MLSGMLCSMFQRQHIEMGGMCSILCLAVNWVACCTAYCVGQYLVLSGADDVQRFVLGCHFGSMFHSIFGCTVREFTGQYVVLSGMMGKTVCSAANRVACRLEQHAG